MEQGYNVSGEYVFRGIEYLVTFRTLKSEPCLSVEVEDKVTGEQWKGMFDTNYIEELTHKTGNFKQFDVFVSMLESALDKATDSVTLDLLTFADLELLRNRKAVSGGYRGAAKQRTTSRQQENKRYLILVYSVEFDRIHYPLPLPYQGKPDPVHLQNLVRQLNEEITKLKSGRNNAYRDDGFLRLKEDYEVVLQEKNALEQALHELKSDIHGGNKLTVSKEVRILKKVVQNLELEMMKEKNRYQRQNSKKSTEIKRLTAELNDLTSRERTLQIRVKSLTNELAMYKRSRTPVTNTRTNVNSSNRDVYTRNSTTRPQSRTRVGSSATRRSGSRDDRGSFTQRRSLSRDRPPSVTRDRSASRDRPYLNRSGYKSRTPTPNRFTRFNPTLYQEEKKRKLIESQERKRRSSGYTGGSSDRRGRTRSRLTQGRYSGGSRNRNGSLDSRNSSDNGSITRNKTRKPPTWENSPVYPTNEQRRLSSTPDLDRHRVGRINKKRTVTNDADIDEIDARLEALQQYMQEIEKK